MSGPQRQEGWGLLPCSPRLECRVCAALGDEPEELRRLRDMYVEGMPEWLLSKVFEIPLSNLHSHAWHKNWHRRRSYNLPDRHLITVIALARMKATWHLADGSSADRMIALLAKLVDAEGRTKVKGEIELKWEDLVHQARRELEEGEG